MNQPPFSPDDESRTPLEGEVVSTPPPQRTQSVELRMPNRKPVLTYIIMGLTIAIYAAQVISEVSQGIDIPALWGMKINQAILAGQYWRLLTPVLLHGSPTHLVFNMYALYSLGTGLEVHYGHRRFLLLYLLGALAGNIMSFLFSANASLGASTAVFGLVAAEAVFVLRNRVLFGKRQNAILTNILFIVAINLYLGMRPGIDNWGHLGGLLGGLAFAWLFGPVYALRQYTFGYIIEEERPPRG